MRKKERNVSFSYSFTYIINTVSIKLWTRFYKLVGFFSLVFVFFLFISNTPFGWSCRIN